MAIHIQLFAPYNDTVEIIGSFNDWQPQALEKRDDGYFETTLELEDGCYEYRFRLPSRSWFAEGETLTVTDPYATEINKATQNGILRIKNGERIIDEYVWQHDETPLAPDVALVMYELHIGDFSGGEGDGKTRGTYADAVDKLDYLRDSGVNALQIMPVQEFGGDFGWGYNPRYFFAAESSYGTTADLKRLIDEAHARGIRVIMDGIFNHSDSESPLTQIDHDYWYHHEPQDPDNSWGPEFNLEAYDEALETFPARRFLGDFARFWVREYHIDGIRFDAARQLANYDFMHWIVEECKHEAGVKPFYAVAEHIPETTDIVGLDGPMDGCWHDGFYHTLVPMLVKGDFEREQLKDILDGRRKGFAGVSSLVNYLANHDHQPLMVELGNGGIFEEEAFRRARLGVALLMTAFGVPLIMMGDEFGEGKAKSQEPNKIDWTLLGNEANEGLKLYHQGLMKLRTEHPALRSETLEFILDDTEQGVLAYSRWSDEGARLVVVANLSGDFLKDYPVTGIENGNWHEWTTNYDTEAQDNTLVTDLGPLEAKVFVR